jgi:hypothetical protein
MALQDTNPDELLSTLAHRPWYIDPGMLQIAEPAKQSSGWRKSTSSLGRLDDLPLELLHATFALLDFKSLSHISRTCIRGIEVVNSVPEYRGLMLHAPDALAALGKTRLIRHHPAAKVHLALLSADCTSCSRYGAFLYLPTCERCCYHCLWKNQSLWLMTIATAKKRFVLSAAGVKTLPVLRSVPGGEYSVGCDSISRLRPVGLVSVGAAKKLAIAEGVSEDTMRAVTEAYHDKEVGGLSENDYDYYRFLQKARITLPQQELLQQQPRSQHAPKDRYCGMGSLPFPSLSQDKHVDHGLWCKGCQLVCRQWTSNDPTMEYMSHFFLRGRQVINVIYHYEEFPRSKAEFLAHIEECAGVKKLLQQAKTL